MKTTILEISEPAIRAALEELLESLPDAESVEVKINAIQFSKGWLKANPQPSRPAEEVANLLKPKFTLVLRSVILGRQWTEGKSGYDFDGLDFQKAQKELVAQIPSNADLLAAKRAELAALEKQCADLESAVRG